MRRVTQYVKTALERESGPTYAKSLTLQYLLILNPASLAFTFRTRLL